MTPDTLPYFWITVRVTLASGLLNSHSLVDLTSPKPNVGQTPILCLPFAGRYAPRLYHQTKCSCRFCLPHMCLAQSRNSALDSRVSIQASYHHLSEGARKGTFNCFPDNQNNAFLCKKDEIYYLSIISN